MEINNENVKVIYDLMESISADQLTVLTDSIQTRFLTRMWNNWG